jgi:hypothetical protein
LKLVENHKMEWEKLKDKIYYWDGAWLDVYVKDTTREDWKIWIDYVNSTYEVSFYNGKADRKEDKISFDGICDYWDGTSDLMSDAVIKVGAINIKCHFFEDTEIENDFDPGEVDSIEEHNNLVRYITNISSLLKKPVFITPENIHDTIHISVDKAEVKIYS